MHYPVMTEKHVADRWQVSLKTLRRWRLSAQFSVGANTITIGFMNSKATRWFQIIVNIDVYKM